MTTSTQINTFITNDVAAIVAPTIVIPSDLHYQRRLQFNQLKEILSSSTTIHDGPFKSIDVIFCRVLLDQEKLLCNQIQQNWIITFSYFIDIRRDIDIDMTLLAKKQELETGLLNMSVGLGGIFSYWNFQSGNDIIEEEIAGKECLGSVSTITAVSFTNA